MTFLLSVFGAAIGIGLLIFVHELGHFIAARLAGVRVEVFSLGFGPRLFGFRRGDTDYRFSAVPLGGYVRVAGEDPMQREGLEDDELYSKGFLARAAFFSGGIVMNVVFALIVFPIVFSSGVQFTAPMVGQLDPGGPAWVAGLEPGDRILEVGGKPMYSFENMTIEFALGGGRGPIPVRYERAGETRMADVSPRFAETGIYEAGIDPPYLRSLPRIRELAQDGPAMLAGISTDDRLVSLGVPGVDAGDLASAYEQMLPEVPVTVTLDRDGVRREVTLTPRRVAGTDAQLGVVPASTRVIALRSAPAIEVLGLAIGDDVIAVDGASFGGPALKTASQRAGPLTLHVRRGTAILALTATLDEAARRALDHDVALGSVDGIVAISPRPRTAAFEAGLLPGDVIRSIDDRKLSDWSDLRAAVRAAGTRPMQMSIERSSIDKPTQSIQIAIAPAPVATADLGFSASFERVTEAKQVDGVIDALKQSFVASIDMIKQIYVTLKRMVTGDVSARNASGIVGISVMTYQQAQRGWAELLYLLAALSLNLAVVNLLPIPLLDGGHLLFLCIERVRGSPVSARVLNYSQVVGLVFVLALVVFVTFNDIRRLFFS